MTNADASRLLGAVLVGDCQRYDTLLRYHLNDIDLPEDPRCLILPDAGGAPLWGGPALLLSGYSAVSSLQLCALVMSNGLALEGLGLYLHARALAAANHEGAVSYYAYRLPSAKPTAYTTCCLCWLH